VVLCRADRDNNSDLWIYEFGRKVMTRLNIRRGAGGFARVVAGWPADPILVEPERNVPGLPQEGGRERGR